MSSSLTQTFYNPNLLKDSDLIRGFIARRPLLEELLDDLRRAGREGGAQHHLLLGQRGLGKTTLLRRLALAIGEDPALAAIWQPLSFPEEQYNIGRLADFWLNCVDALSEALDGAGRTSEAARLDAQLEALGTQPTPEAALALLRQEATRLGRRLLLLVDNLDLVLDRVGAPDQEWAFRKVLSGEKHITIMGASSRVLEAFYEHGRAFYDFFQVHELKGLDDAETFAVLTHLAEEAGAEPVKRILAEQPARLRTLRLLTGGNPRTIALLFRIFQREGKADPAEPSDGETQQDLEQLLDLYTPLYKARFEELPAQAQKLVDAMAIHWDPMTAGDLAERIALPVNTVSAQLKRLDDLGVVEKVPWFGEKKTGFQIAERFFNIWYLMRASRRVRRRLVWFVRFLAAWFTEEELQVRAELLLQSGKWEMAGERYAELSFAYAEVTRGERLRHQLELEGLRTVLADDQLRRSIDFSDLSPALQDRKERMDKMRELAAGVPAARPDWGEIDPREFWRLLGGSPYYDVAEKERVVESLPGLSLEQVRELYQGLRQAEERVRRHWSRKLVRELYEALAAGEMADPFDWKAAAAIGGVALACIAVGCRWICDLTRVSADDVSRSETVYREMMLREDLASRAWDSLCDLLLVQRRYEEAEAADRRSIELDPQRAYPWFRLGYVLQVQRRYEEAEAAYRRCIELAPQLAYPWHGLGNLLKDQRRYEEAEAAHRRSIELDPQFAYPWSDLGNLYRDRQKPAEAAVAYLSALRLDAGFRKWDETSLLGVIRQLALTQREAALAFARQAVETLPQSHDAAFLLAQLLVQTGDWGGAVALVTPIAADSEATADEEGAQFAAAAVAAGRTKDLLALLEQTGAHDRWRPLYEALRAVEAGSTDYLRRVAPEVRQVAEQVYRKLVNSALTGVDGEAGGPTGTDRKSGR